MRFSKQSLAIYLARRIRAAQKTFGFHDRSGWNQVAGKGEEINRAYGEYIADLNTMQNFNLDWPTEEEKI
jgi:hypothetical protein